MVAVLVRSLSFVTLINLRCIRVPKTPCEAWMVGTLVNRWLKLKFLYELLVVVAGGHSSVCTKKLRRSAIDDTKDGSELSVQQTVVMMT